MVAGSKNNQHHNLIVLGIKILISYLKTKYSSTYYHILRGNNEKQK